MTGLDIPDQPFAAPISCRQRSSARFRRGLKVGSGGTLVGLGVAAAIER
ncbi:hypothetical protein [Deinococcus sp.]